MFAWGINDYGQLGDGSTSYATSPVKVVGLEGLAIADISAGGWHSLALTADGGASYSCPAQQVTSRPALISQPPFDFSAASV